MRRWEEQQGRRARESILSSLHYTAKDRQERDTGNDTRMDTVALLEEALLIAESALRSSSEVTVAPSTVTVVDDPDARESRDDTNL